MQDHAVAGIIVVLVCVLGDGAGPHLRWVGWGVAVCVGRDEEGEKWGRGGKRPVRGKGATREDFEAPFPSPSGLSACFSPIIPSSNHVFFWGWQGTEALDFSGWCNLGLNWESRWSQPP